jgi:LEA14-like dessication related protein
MHSTFDEAKRKRSGSNKALAWVLVLAVVALAVAVVVLVAKTGAGNTVRVPALVGKDMVAAAELAARSGLAVREQAQVRHDTVPAGCVVAQVPEPGTKAEKNDTILVTVSKGRLTHVPALAGFKRDDAAAELGRAGLSPGRVSTASSNEFPAGRIIGSSPEPGSEVAPGTPVDVVISTGPRVVPPPQVPATFVRPGMRLASLELGEPDQRGFNLAVGIEADNPNGVAGAVRGFYYKLEVDTFFLGDGKYLCNAPLSANGRSQMVINVHVRHDCVGPAAVALLRRGEVDYRVRGYYILEAEGGRSFEPIYSSGTFNLADKLGPYLGRIYGE